MDIDNIRNDNKAAPPSQQQLPPPIPPLPDHYSARPSNLPLPAEGYQTDNQQHAVSPLYENTNKPVLPDTTYSLADEVPHDNSPRHEIWFHGKLSRNAVSIGQILSHLISQNIIQNNMLQRSVLRLTIFTLILSYCISMSIESIAERLITKL